MCTQDPFCCHSKLDAWTSCMLIFFLKKLLYHCTCIIFFLNLYVNFCRVSKLIYGWRQFIWLGGFLPSLIFILVETTSQFLENSWGDSLTNLQKLELLQLMQQKPATWINHLGMKQSVYFVRLLLSVVLLSRLMCYHPIHVGVLFICSITSRKVFRFWWESEDAGC